MGGRLTAAVIARDHGAEAATRASIAALIDSGRCFHWAINLETLASVDANGCETVPGRH
jgi:hypothetical protein